MAMFIKTDDDHYWDASVFQRFEASTSSPWSVDGFISFSQSTELARYATQQEAEDALVQLIADLSQTPPSVIEPSGTPI